MVRISKQEERRMTSPRKYKKPSPKTGAQKDNLTEGYNVHQNAVKGELATKMFIPFIKSVK